MNFSRRIVSTSLVVAALLAPAGSALAEDAKKDGAPSLQFSKDMDAFLAKDENLDKLGTALAKYYQKKQQDERKNEEADRQKRTEEQFNNPVKVDIAGSPVKGKPDAKITVVEFSDFQCPYCKRGFDVVKEILKSYPNDVKIVFKHLPLPFHQQARPAALATVAAQQQGKFWEMHDLLFENQSALGPDKYVEYAQQLGLDVEKFKKDMASDESGKKVDADAELANSLGIHGTPGFFVNGVQVDGAQPFAVFKGLIDKWLDRMKPKA